MEPLIHEAEECVVSRFAPSPTGKLHFGSLISALASYLEARASGGKWVVRIEDIDPPREIAGSADSILQSLEAIGLTHDGSVLYQATRLKTYHAVVQELLDLGKAFWCGCTRKELPASGIYPGTCRNGIPPGKTRRAIRLRVDDQPIRFTDLIQGEVTENLAEQVGDFIILRADGLPAYQLAVVVDDAHQEITDIIRGMDLFSSTARQIFLQNCLGFPTPRYAHHPLALHQDGQKLGKRFGSVPITSIELDRALFYALEFLGQSPPRHLNRAAILRWARENWQLAKVPNGSGIDAPIIFQPD